jgi:TolA-binding protein
MRKLSMVLGLALAGYLVAGLPAGAQDPAAAEGDLRLAAEALKKGDEAQAWELYSRNADAFAKSWEGLDDNLVAWVPEQLRKQKRYADSLDLCSKILAKEGAVGPAQQAAVMLVRGDVFRDQENFSAARLEYQSLEKNKAFANTDAGRRSRFRLVDIMRVTRDFEAAEEGLERLKDSQNVDDQVEAYYLSARMAFDRDDLTAAREFIEEVKRRSPAHVETLFLEAEVNLKEDRLQDPELEIGSKVLTTYVVPGRPVTMKMQDRNLAVVRGGSGIPVVLRTSKGNDSETIMLSPSVRDPSLFRGMLSTRLGESKTNNLYLEITGADVISYNLLDSFQKANGLSYPDKSMVVVADGEISATSGDFISEDERDQELFRLRVENLVETSETLKAYEKESMRNTSVVRPGNPIHVQVVDFDRDVGPQKDRVFVEVETSSGDKIAGVELVETNEHCGVFQGDIPTSIAPPKGLASDSAPGSKPGSVVDAKDPAPWTSAADGKKPKWFEVDLMTVQPLAEAVLELAGGSVSAVTLLGATSDELKPVAGSVVPDRVAYGYVDLVKQFGEQSKTAAYIYTEIPSEVAADVVLKIGSCDGVMVWVNGQSVHKNLGGRLWKPEEDAVKAKFKAGVNAVLLKVTKLTGPWGASMTVLDATGKPFPGVKVFAPAKPGVVTQWYVFNRMTPEEIEVPERITVDKPVRVGGEPFRWVPYSVVPPAALSIEGNLVKVTFNGDAALRRLRWSFDDFQGQSVSVKEVTVKNKFGDTVVPAATEFAAAASNRELELGPGDRIQIRYTDEKRTREAGLALIAAMSSGFHDAEVELQYESIGQDPQGQRKIFYDRALRYVPGTTDRLVVRVTDYDADTSAETDKVKVLVRTSAGESLWMEAMEDEPHSGSFIAILRLGDATGNDTVKIQPGDAISASYQDRENADGQLEKLATVTAAPKDPPELLLYQRMVFIDTEGVAADEEEGGVVTKTVLPARTKAEAAAPVVTSVDTSLYFKVVYPAAAISVESTLNARLATERELAAAKAEGREPAYTTCKLELLNPDDAEFDGEVLVRTGNPTDYADEQEEKSTTPITRRLTPQERWLMQQRPKIYARPDDVILVEVAGETTNAQGRYKLASDALLTFTDSKYTKPVKQVYLGDYLYLKLSDRDQDVTEGLDSVTVTLASGASSNDVALVETLPRSGFFTGRIRTELGLPGLPAPKAGEGGTGAVVRLQFGERLTASYLDKVSVISAQPRRTQATVGVYQGADGALATFTKLFADEDIAVKTRLLMAEALFELAKSHREAGQKELGEKEIVEGKAILEEAIADYPNTAHAPHAEFLLANLAQELEKFEEAITRYDKVLSNWPNSEFAAKAMLRKGICQEKINDVENALDTYVELTYSYPNSPLISDAVIRLGQYFYKTSKFDVAGRIFGNFQQRNPEHDLAAKALFLAGQSYLKGAEERKKAIGGKYDQQCNEWLQESIAKFQHLSNTYDDKDLRAEAMYWMADGHLKLRDMVNAYRSFKKVTWEYPESKWAKFARGQLVQYAKEFERIEEEE